MNDLRKICYVTTIPSTLESFVLPIVHRIPEQLDWEITLICDEDEKFQQTLPEGVRYIPVPMKRGVSISGIGSMLKMVKIFRKEKFDLVQYSTPNASLYASLAAWFARVPVRLYCQWGIAYVGFSGIKRRIFKCIEKLVCALSTWVEPDSFGNLRFSRKEGLYTQKKSSVIWNGSASGVDLAKFDASQKTVWREKRRAALGIDPEALVCGFVGRITGDKGINELFSAFQKVLQSHPDAYLILVGDPEKEESLNKELYYWARQEKHVRFCGYTNVVEQYLSTMDVYILPSYREGFGSGVIEAEAMGVPVIVSDIPGPTDAMVPDQTGLTVPVKNVDALVAAINQLIEDPALRSTFGEHAKVYAAESFEQQRLAEHIIADRKRLLGEK